MGHFQSVCQSSAHRVRGIHTTTPASLAYANESNEYKDQSEYGFLGAVISETSLQNPWVVTVELNGVPIECYIDTGAEVTVITEDLYHRVGSPSLMVPDKTLKSANNQPLSVKGMFVGHFYYHNMYTDQHCYVISDLAKPLLGRPAIEKLKLLARIRAIQKSTSSVEQFPQLFTGLGRLPDLYTIKLSEAAKPFSLHVPRRVAVPLMQAVKQELSRMEQLGVIAPVQEPTAWCSGMVVVPKPNGQVRICVDLTQLNKSVCRERYPLLAVEQILSQLAGATVFSKLDANSGFW